MTPIVTLGCASRSLQQPVISGECLRLHAQLTMRMPSASLDTSTWARKVSRHTDNQCYDRLIRVPLWYAAAVVSSGVAMMIMMSVAIHCCYYPWIALFLAGSAEKVLLNAALPSKPLLRQPLMSSGMACRLLAP